MIPDLQTILSNLILSFNCKKKYVSNLELLWANSVIF